MPASQHYLEQEVRNVLGALLSDHYSRTRQRYYQRLADASRKRDEAGFVQYALDGFVDLLREQIATVQAMQRDVAWINYVHESFSRETHLTRELAEMYAARSDKTLSHDLNRLRELGLVEGDARGGYLPRIDLMDAFLPANSDRERTLPRNTRGRPAARRGRPAARKGMPPAR